MMNALSESLKKDGIIFSFEGLANTVSALFGYDSAKEMVDDEDFSNEKLTEIRYVYHDPSYLSKRLEDIVTDEDSENRCFSTELSKKPVLSNRRITLNFLDVGGIQCNVTNGRPVSGVA